MSGQEQFGKSAYWMPPENFEKSRKGDCDDFARYAWRRLLEMRITLCGWNDRRRLPKTCLGNFRKRRQAFSRGVQAPFPSLRFPRLEALRYRPDVFVEWDGHKPKFLFHKPKRYLPPTNQMPWLILERLLFHIANLPSSLPDRDRVGPNEKFLSQREFFTARSSSSDNPL